jgi:hypothetical protein
VDDVQAKQAPLKEAQKKPDGRNGPSVEHQDIGLARPIRVGCIDLECLRSETYPGESGRANTEVEGDTLGSRQSRDL